MDFVSCLQQLSMLRLWAPGLERLSPALKTSVWKACRHIVALKRYTAHESGGPASFSGAVATWTRSPAPSQSAITGLFAAICLLRAAGILGDEFTVDPVTMTKHLREMAYFLQSQQQQSRSPTPPMLPPGSSPVNFSPVSPQLHGPRLFPTGAQPFGVPTVMSPLMVPPSPPAFMMGARAPSPLSSSPLPPHMTPQTMAALGLGFMPPANSSIRPVSPAGASAGFVRPQARVASVSPLPVHQQPAEEAASSPSRKRKSPDSALLDLVSAAKSPKLDESSTPSATGPPGNGGMNISAMLT